MSLSRVSMLLVVVLLAPSLAQKQSPRSSTTSLAKPLDLGAYTSRLFPDSQKVTFKLTTSWIPGENHKGMMRYRLIAIPEQLDPPDPSSANLEATAQLIKRVHACSIFINLYDVDDFILRKIAVPFDEGVDEQARPRSLYANEAIQMDAQEYRNFSGMPNGQGGGSWNVSWNCGSR